MIDILWDASHLWGFLARNALLASGLSFRLLKAEKIAQAGLSGKVLLAPGGSARAKAAALGPAGREAIRLFVERGGHYLGICGGAGLALAEGLGLCPWHRAGMPDRMQHMVSGHIACSLRADALAPPAMDTALLPVWWPARFEEEAGGSSDLTVLARYAAPGPDLYVADLPYAMLPSALRAQWQSMYGVNMRPSLLDKQPCVVHGSFGRGHWLLSYSHLESPAASPPPGIAPGVSDASRLFFHILGRWLGEDLSGRGVPEWCPDRAPPRWEDKTLLDARERLEKLLDLAESLGLLFARRPWLRGWRGGVPGPQCNSLHLALITALSLEPTPVRVNSWRHACEDFARRFRVFEQGARDWLLARRLSETLSEALPRALLVDQKSLLFGSPMSSDGLCGELQDALEDLLFAE